MEVELPLRQTRRDRGPFDREGRPGQDLEDLYIENEGLAGVTER